MIHTQDADFTLLNCDVLDGLRSLESGSVHCVVTSPPYWGLRDYGTGEWEGGDPDHEHAGSVARTAPPGTSKQASNTGANAVRSGDCACGARRLDRQLGLEATPEEYVARMVDVFREVRRVLRADGTCWLNLGDSYASSPPGNKGTPDEAYKSSGLAGAKAGSRYMQTLASSVGTKRNTVVGDLKPKDLVGIPWRVAFALQADGWYLRSDIIWSKPNPMPESVTDRPTKSHEYVFLLTKSAKYFFDQEAVREDTNDLETKPWAFRNGDATVTLRNDEGNLYMPRAGRNIRSVWDIATQPYPEAHFATYPEELVRRCVLAGTSERGCCPECGKPWEREIEVERTLEAGRREIGLGYKTTGIGPVIGVTTLHHDVKRETLGWHSGCDHEADPIPCTVLDPFLGSGTTAHVARKHGRRSIGIELNPDYCELAAKRMQQQSLEFA